MASYLSLQIDAGLRGKYLAADNALRPGCSSCCPRAHLSTPSSSNLRTTPPTVSRWKAQFLRSGVDGLDTDHPGQSATADAVAAGQDIIGHAEEARGRIDALELSQTGCGSGYQQRHRTSRLEGSRPETASA